MPCRGRRAVAVDAAGEGAQIRTTSADAEGLWRLDIKPQTNATYRAEVGSDSGCRVASSKEIAVAVKAKVRITATPKKLRPGGCSSIDAFVSPNKAGSEVRLEHKTRKGWRTLAKKELDGTSQALFTKCFKSPGAQVGQDLVEVRSGQLRSPQPGREDPGTALIS